MTIKHNAIRTIISIILCLAFAGGAFGSSYPEANELMEKLAANVIYEMEAKSQWRYDRVENPNPTLEEINSQKYEKTAWKPGDRQPVAIYAFTEEATKLRHPFADHFERQLTLAMDSSSKFFIVTREMEKFEEMKFKETRAEIDGTTAAKLGKVLGARFFLTGTYWHDGSATFIQAALWDADRGTAVHSQVKIGGWDRDLVKSNLRTHWWKGLTGGLALVILCCIIHFLNKTALFNMRASEKWFMFFGFQAAFVVLFILTCYVFARWWLYTS